MPQSPRDPETQHVDSKVTSKEDAALLCCGSSKHMQGHQGTSLTLALL